MFYLLLYDCLTFRCNIINIFFHRIIFLSPNIYAKGYSYDRLFLELSNSIYKITKIIAAHRTNGRNSAIKQ